MLEINKIYQGEALEILKTFESESVDCVVTSPPYWGLRDYNVDKQLGLEETFTEYIDKLCNIFDEVKRVLKKTGTCFVNLGDTYNSHSAKSKNVGGFEGMQMKNNIEYSNTKISMNKNYSLDKCLLQIPSRFAIEMTNRGWILRNELIWWKPNSMPSSAKDRFTVDFEKVFFFVKNKKYYFEQQFEKFKWATYERSKWNSNSSKLTGIHGGMTVAKQLKYFEKVNSGEVTGRNKRCVWKVSTQAFHGAHFAVYPEKLIIPMIKSGCPENGVVLDPFMGAGTTGLVSVKLKRQFIGIELNPEYIKIAEKRINAEIDNQATKLFT